MTTQSGPMSADTTNREDPIMTEPTQPLTDEELAAIARRADIADSIDYVCDEGTMTDLRRLLAEVDRLQSELEDWKELVREGERIGMQNVRQLDEKAGEVDRLRAENTAQAATIAEAEYLAEGWSRVGSGWSSLNMAQAAKYRALIDCSKALARALGVGDSEKGTTDAAA